MTVFPVWTWAAPLAALPLAVAAFVLGLPLALGIACAAALLATVFAAVHHAELVAHRIGEPFGTLVLALAVTIIEVGLILSVMLGKPSGQEALARDTVFAAVMLVANGVVGLCLVVGGLRHGTQGFRLQGAAGSVAVLGALTVLTLVVPNYTTAIPGPIFSPHQLAFAGVVSLVLYGTFVFVQTITHKADFTQARAREVDDAEDVEPHHHGPPPTTGQAWLAALLLTVSLVVTVALAKALSPTLEAAIAQAELPKALLGIIIAAIVLLPETITAIRAARQNQLQTSLNLALGSALASIGLTIPAVAVLSLTTGQPLTLGLDPQGTVFLALTLLTLTLTLGTGRTTLLQGAVHLTIATSYLFLTAVP